MNLLYIDPGTGSMIFSVFLGLAAAAYFLFRTFLIKVKVLFLGKNKALQSKSAFVIYNEANHYWPVFKPITDEFEKRGIDVQYLTSSETDPVFINDYKYVHPVFIGADNKAFASLNFIEADVCLMTTPGLEVYQLKRSKLCKHYAHILHEPGDAIFYKLFGIDWFDSIFLSGEYQKKDIRKLEKLRCLPEKELIVTGSTYLDYYNNKLKNYSENDHVFTVLVSPSWGTAALLSVMGDSLLESLKNTEWRVIVRPHPQSKKSEVQILKPLEEKFTSFIWDYNSENTESLSKADIMISDFSGVIFDYAFLFNKPILYHKASLNKNIYDAGDIEDEPWKFIAVKHFGREITENDLPNIKEIIQQVIADSSLTSEIQKAKDTAWQNRGKSGITAVDALVSIRNNILETSSKETT